MPRPDSSAPWHWLRVVLLGVVLCTPLAVMLSPSLQSWAGSRKPDFPEWSWRVGDLKRFPGRFQEAFDAALPFRVNVAAPSRSYFIDGLGVSPIPDVMLGADGWLYYAGPVGERLFDRYVRGRDPLSQDELEAWRRALVERTRRFRDMGVKYVLVIAPNKESIYPEHLPGWIGIDVRPARLDQLLAYLRSAPELTVIDLRASLIADKTVAPLYFKTDTHWNTRGAHAAYREIVRVLAPLFPELTVRSWESFRPQAGERRGMDLARMIGMGGDHAEADFELAHSACAERRAVSIPIPAALQAKLTTPAYATRCDAPGGVDAVIFHDSFGVALIPLLAESFRSSAQFSAQSGPDDAMGYGVPEALKANLVLEIMVERSLGAIPR